MVTKQSLALEKLMVPQDLGEIGDSQEGVPSATWIKCPDICGSLVALRLGLGKEKQSTALCYRAPPS